MKLAELDPPSTLPRDMTSKSKFTQGILNWARLRPDDENSAFILENYKDSEKESEKWRLIGTALEQYERRLKEE
jgi:hypothetical protein